MESLWLAITLGLGSSFTHCAGMCGPIHIALQKNSSPWAPYYYHIGRVLGYTLLGFALGLFFQGQEMIFPPEAKKVTGTLLAAFYIYAAWSFYRGGHSVEKFLGRFFPRKLYNKYLLNGRASALFPAGLLASLLPCPTTVAALGYSLWLGKPFTSAFSMFSFGVATLPFFAVLAFKPIRHLFDLKGWLPKLVALLFCVLSAQKIWMVWFAATPQCH